MFLHTVNVIGQPQKPECESPDFSRVIFGSIPLNIRSELKYMDEVIFYAIIIIFLNLTLFSRFHHLKTLRFMRNILVVVYNLTINGKVVNVMLWNSSS